MGQRQITDNTSEGQLQELIKAGYSINQYRIGLADGEAMARLEVLYKLIEYGLTIDAAINLSGVDTIISDPESLDEIIERATQIMVQEHFIIAKNQITMRESVDIDIQEVREWEEKE